MCEHLEALSSGQIRKLIINVPPGHMKSLTCAVFWNAWIWLSDPSVRMIHASYSDDLTTRDSRKFSSLIKSSEFSGIVGSRGFALTKDTESRIENDKGGFHIATSTGGMGTGERAHIVTNDDLLRANDFSSDAKLKQAIEHLKAMSTRGVVGYPFRQLLIMQRLAQGDPTGYLLEQGGYTHLRLPAEFEPSARCETSIVGRVWKGHDPRTEDGEPLWKEAVTAEMLAEKRIELGSFRYGGQYQQSPTTLDGNLFKPERIGIVDALPAGLVGVRGWDFAATEVDATSNKDPDYTVGARVARASDGRIYIVDIVRLRGSAMAVEQALMNTASKDGFGVAVSIPQDPGQAGKSQAQRMVAMLGAYTASSSVETGDKVVRAMALVAQVEAGNVYMLRGPWNQALLDEMGPFPNAKHDDQVDALSRAYHAMYGTTTGLLDYYAQEAARIKAAKEAKTN